MHVSAIIVAAGSGTRLGLAEPKAFVKLNGRPLLDYSLEAISQVQAIDEVVITVPPAMEARARERAGACGLGVPVKVTPGGAERQDSVRIALALTSSESEVIIVHDAARPFAEPALFQRCLELAHNTGGAIASAPLADTLKRAENGIIQGTIQRAGIYLAQTPQAFQRRLLAAAHERAKREHIVATDDADLVEQMGASVAIVESAGINLKITSPADLAIAELLAARLPLTH